LISWIRYPRWLGAPRRSGVILRLGEIVFDIAGAGGRRRDGRDDPARMAA